MATVTAAAPGNATAGTTPAPLAVRALVMSCQAARLPSGGAMSWVSTSGVLGKFLDGEPESDGRYVRLDCDLVVEPGSRAARYAVGFGAGKSRSIFEITLRDHASGDELGLYHGYGTGSGMGFKVAGGGARKMTEDDIQENAAYFVELLREVL